MWVALISRELNGTPVRRKYKCREASNQRLIITFLYVTLRRQLESHNAMLSDRTNVWHACSKLHVPINLSMRVLRKLVDTEFHHHETYKKTGYVDIDKRDTSVMCDILCRHALRIDDK
jgi:hypothetical protein